MKLIEIANAPGRESIWAKFPFSAVENFWRRDKETDTYVAELMKLRTGILSQGTSPVTDAYVKEVLRKHRRFDFKRHWLLFVAWVRS